jgi:hypothetical protein
MCHLEFCYSTRLCLQAAASNSSRFGTFHAIKYSIPHTLYIY